MSYDDMVRLAQKGVGAEKVLQGAAKQRAEAQAAIGRAQAVVAAAKDARQLRQLLAREGADVNAIVRQWVADDEAIAKMTPEQRRDAEEREAHEEERAKRTKEQREWQERDTRTRSTNIQRALTRDTVTTLEAAGFKFRSDEHRLATVGRVAPYLSELVKSGAYGIDTAMRAKDTIATAVQMFLDDHGAEQTGARDEVLAEIRGLDVDALAERIGPEAVEKIRQHILKKHAAATAPRSSGGQFAPKAPTNGTPQGRPPTPREVMEQARRLREGGT